MDYKEKYEMALETIQEILDSGSDSIKMSRLRLRLQSVFPELAGSEDEQIRKELTKHLKEGVEGYMPAGDSSDYRRWLDWLEKQDKSSDQIHYWTEEEIESIISDYLRGAEHYGGMIARLRCLKPKSLEKQDEQKQEINNFDVLPGLYKCVHRMFDGTPEDRLLFEVGNVYRCLSKRDRAEFEVSYGHSVYLEDPVVCKHFIPFEKQDEQKPTQEIEPFEAEHGKYYYCIKDYFCGGRKQASKGDVVQALRGLPIMGLKDAGEYFLPVNSIKCNSTWSKEDEEMRLTILQDLQYIKDQFPEVNVEPEFNWLKSLKRIGG